MDRFVRWFEKIDFWVYLVFSLACTAYAANTFYAYMRVQTGGDWSAPLDDVFIHFDYARATARGYPFQWSEGNGFSSGNTSLSYPFVLSFGYWLGFRGLLLMKWAAIVACASIAVFLGLGAKLFERFGRWAKYLLPPALLSVGALDWSLFSGMENAFHLCTWALALGATFYVIDGACLGKGPIGRAILAGLAGALLFLTRPESVVCVATFAVWGALAVRKKRREAIEKAALSSEKEGFPWRVFLPMSVPGVLAFGAQAIANKVYTGEWAAAGAIAKLALNHPYMTGEEKWAQYTDLLKYVVLRNTHHHFADFDATHPIPWGWLVVLAAVLPFLGREIRGLAAMLWVQVIGWLLLVSLNGQVRWQNERYTMPAVAWLLVLAAMGLATLIGAAWRKEPHVAQDARAQRISGGLRIAGAALIAGLFWNAQIPRMRDQIWFFGRASRNIRDQHIVAGRVLKQMGVERVLVGDAGALIYASDRPGMDLIGLGGYHDFPFARAGVHGLGATLELIERVPSEDRPDVMAIYPSWWGDLPLFFGKRITEIPVFGNVICGGSEKVIYRADWSTFDRSGRPRSMNDQERRLDEVDVADLMSESSHRYDFSRPAGGFVAFRLLADPDVPSRDLFDAGRVIAPSQRETMRVYLPPTPTRLVMRTSPELNAKIDVYIDGANVGRMEIGSGPARPGGKKPKGPATWVEPSFPLPAGQGRTVRLELVAAEGAFVDYHLWIVGAADADSQP